MAKRKTKIRSVTHHKGWAGLSPFQIIVIFSVFVVFAIFYLG